MASDDGDKKGETRKREKDEDKKSEKEVNID